RNIKYAYLRADNAGCYHAAETLLSNKKVFEETGIFIRRFDYSDPQSGKSACDRMSAVVKCNVRRHINEKNNVENSKEFVDAARTTQYLSIFASKIVPHSVVPKSKTSNKKINWTGVTMFNNVQYEIKSSKLRERNREEQIPSNDSDEIEITAWRSYNIGSGKEFTWSNLNTVQTIDQLVVTYEPSLTQGNWMNENIKEDANDDRQSDSEFEEDEKTEEGKNHNKNDVAKNNSKPFVFDCPDPNCIRQFRRHANLQVHLSTGIHKYQPNRLKLLDKAKLHYKEQLENDENEHIRSIQNFKIIHSSNGNVNYELKQGWALFNRKPQILFSDDQVTYLVQKYNEGEKNGMKWNPSQVAEQMQTTINNGHYVFEPSQWLTSSQIKSFFGRLTRKRRQQSQLNKEREEKNEELSEDDESLIHAQLMQDSIKELEEKQTDASKQEQYLVNSQSTIRKMDNRSIDEYSKLHPKKK
ncbi:unnamed protein product, partial [Rotaria sp. Silwood1]